MSNEDKPTIKTNKPSDENRNDFFISISLKGAKQLREYLKIDENSYRYVASTAHTNARDYYIYGVLDEIEKAGMVLMNTLAFISEKEGEIKTGQEIERLTRNIYAMTVGDLAAWVRKLTEILIEVAGFKSSNSQEYFQHYLLLHDLVRNKRTQDDFIFYHAGKSENIEYQINESKKRIQNLMSKLDYKKCWYVKKNKQGLPTTSLSKYKDRLNEILPKLDSAQRLAIGLSYQGYSNLSGNIHFEIGEADYRTGMKEVEGYFSNIGILCAHILLICKAILGKKPRGFLGQLNRVFIENDYPKKLLKNKVSPNSIHLGDFVIAYSDIAEVIKINKSTFGYKSYRVRFLGRPPLPTTLEDEFPAVYVRFFQNRKFIVNEIKRRLKQQTPDLKISNKRVVDSVRETVRKMWEEFGYKELAYGRKDLAVKKMEDFIKREKEEIKPPSELP